MTGKVFIPPNAIGSTPGKLIFLAGPIQHEDDWQTDAIDYIRSIDKDVHIASPKRADHGDFDEQVDWETTHLRRAGENGVVLFWLAKEVKHDCSRVFAKTTRLELFEWKMMHTFKGAQLVVGIENGFTGARYIKRRFSQDCPDVPICSNLEKTCKKAIELCQK